MLIFSIYLLNLYQFSISSQKMKKSQKNIDKFIYPHPILKSFTSLPQQQSNFPTHAYQPSHVSNINTVPYKLVQSTHIQPLLGSSLSLLVHPLHPAVDFVRCKKQQIYSCIKCKCKMNSVSMYKLSFFQYKCKFCHTVNEVQFENGRYLDYTVADIQKQQGQKEQLNKKVLFVLEANQHLYKKQILPTIFQCLRALNQKNQYENDSSKLNRTMSMQTQNTQSQKQQQSFKQLNNDYYSPTLNVGFMFYDTNRMYTLNMQMKQIVILQPQQFCQDFPLSQKQLLQPLNQIDLQEIQLILQEIMYQSYEINTACLLNTLKMCNRLANDWQIQTKLFSCSFDKSMLASTTTPKNAKSQNTQKLTLSPYIQMNLFNYSLFNSLLKMGLSQNIDKFYQFNKINCTDLYYYLYHVLTQERYYKVQMQIFTTHLVEYSHKVKDKIINDLGSSKSIIPLIDTNRPLILDFSIPKIKKQSNSSANKKHGDSLYQTSYHQQCIQIKFILSRGSHKIQRVITYKLGKINPNPKNQPYLLNDQTFFFVLVHKFLNDRTTTSIKKSLLLKGKQIIQRILEKQDQFVIPKNLVNFFMYSHMLIQNQLLEKQNNSQFLYNKRNFGREGMQTISKSMYPKMYEFYPQLRALKYKPKFLQHDTIRLIDNGKFIGIVVGDEISVKLLQKIFNNKIIDDIIELTQIPVLQNEINNKIHEAIYKIRQNNFLYFLPIKIIIFGSQIYDEFYGNYLYMEQQHKKFFNDLIKIS